jgi:hypothetical protein
MYENQNKEFKENIDDKDNKENSSSVNKYLDSKLEIIKYIKIIKYLNI